jgi:hypothetical protein
LTKDRRGRHEARGRDEAKRELLDDEDGVLVEIGDGEVAVGQRREAAGAFGRTTKPADSASFAATSIFVGCETN